MKSFLPLQKTQLAIDFSRTLSVLRFSKRIALYSTSKSFSATSKVWNIGKPAEVHLFFTSVASVVLYFNESHCFGASVPKRLKGFCSSSLLNRPSRTIFHGGSTVVHQTFSCFCWYLANVCWRFDDNLSMCNRNDVFKIFYEVFFQYL